MILIIIFIFLFLLTDVLTQTAYAYLDPGTGSYIFQILIASFVGGLFAIKLFWRQIILFFKKLFSKNQKKSEHQP